MGITTCFCNVSSESEFRSFLACIPSILARAPKSLTLLILGITPPIPWLKVHSSTLLWIWFTERITSLSVHHQWTSFTDYSNKGASSKLLPSWISTDQPCKRLTSTCKTKLANRKGASTPTKWSGMSWLGRFPACARNSHQHKHEASFHDSIVDYFSYSWY